MTNAKETLIYESLSSFSTDNFILLYLAPSILELGDKIE